ncbi:MAG: hypothetical protein QOJ90_575 [Actinomycetota bacterium]|nr:hypothetical protein [Actinomycetota bacterium]
MIDWVPFVRVHGRTFDAAGANQPIVVPADRIGDVVAVVSCRIADVVTDPSYRPRDGDASFLPVGTALHAFSGGRPDLRLAARENGSWRVYQVTDLPTARTGADLLDLGGGVLRIELLDGDTATRVLDSVSEAATVQRIVGAVLAAPTEPLKPGGVSESPLFVRFVLADGTFVERPWQVQARLLANRLRAPAELSLLHASG